jgi:hypothetical protein
MFVNQQFMFNEASIDVESLISFQCVPLNVKSCFGFFPFSIAVFTSQDAKEYKDIPDSEASRRAAFGQQIFQKYLAKDASEPINVNSHNMAEVTQNMAKGEVWIFAG